MRKLLVLVVLACVALLAGGSSAWADPKKNVFAVQLECEDGSIYDALSPGDGTSFAALAQGSNVVAVLKGVDANADGTLEFLVPGFEPADLTACDAFTQEAGQQVFLFVAYVLLTPRGS